MNQTADIFLNRCRRECTRSLNRVYFAGGEDERVIQAARILADGGAAVPVLVGRSGAIRELAEAKGISTHKIRITTPAQLIDQAPQIKRFWHAHHREGMRLDRVRQLFESPLDAAVLASRLSPGDYCIAGKMHIPARVLRSALKPDRLQNKSSLVSAFAVAFDSGDQEPLLFADVAMVPRPNVMQLADIAEVSAITYQRLNDIEPRVAMLSFSTAGSAGHERAKTVKEAFEILHSRQPEWQAAGEIQFDAALIPEIGHKKNPDSSLKRAANVFIFPSLNAGNIGIQMMRYLTGFRVLGPFLQGGIHSVGIVPMDATAEEMADTAICGLAFKKGIQRN